MLRNIRFYVLLGSLLFSLAAYGWVSITFAGDTIQTIRLTQIYALTAFTLLYFTLLIGPLCFYFKKSTFSLQLMKSRRALGVSAFYFGLLHASLAFFKQLGGFEGLGFLSDTYIIAISFSFTALIIMFVLTVTSVDWVIKNMSFAKWKGLHRLIYIAAVFILIHALMLGTHFKNLSEFIPQIFLTAAAILACLEAIRFDNYLQTKFANLPRFGIISAGVLGFILVAYIYSLLPAGATLPLGIHAQHITIAKENQQSNVNTSIAKLPGMDGDRTKRYTTSFLHPNMVLPNQKTELEFKVFDASSGQKIRNYKIIYEKPAHLIIVSSDLRYFNHIHPTPTEEGFTISTEFPKVGEYHLYLDYQPFGGIEQQMGFTMTVGDQIVPSKSIEPADTNYTKTFGDYQVTLDFPKQLEASKLSVGQQNVTFTIKDKSGRPVTTLKPYLASFGHLVMINQNTYEYLHVHPTNPTPPKPNENGGPQVSFMPLGLYGSIKPGVYKVFAQFNPDGKLFIADFMVEVK